MELTDAQWCALHLLKHAKEIGKSPVARYDLLEMPSKLPMAVRVKLMFAILTMPDGLIEWSHANQQAFSISEEGIELFQSRFGNTPAKETSVPQITPNPHS